LERLARALSGYDQMKKLDDKISDIWKLPQFNIISQKYDSDDIFIDKKLEPIERNAEELRSKKSFLTKRFFRTFALTCSYYRLGTYKFPARNFTAI
jgi:hypothetical protein